MHLVLISGTALSARNGSSRVEHALARELARIGHRVTLLTRDLEPLPSPEGFIHAIYRRPSSKDWRSWLLAGRVAARLEALDAEHRVDLVHAFHLGPPAYYAQRFGRPYLVTHHDMRLELGWRQRRALAGAEAVIALNAAQAERLAPYARSLELIGNGVGGAEELPPPSELPEGYVLFAGRFEAAKGVHLLLDAYARLGDARPPLVLAGDGRDADLVRARAASLGAVVLPWLEHGALLGVLSRARALALPSRSEASPLLLLEAYARGVPALVHDLPELAGALCDPDGAPRAERVPIGDEAAWARALVAPADPAKIARGRQAALARSWASVAARYAAVYERVASSTAAGRHSGPR